MRAKVVSALMFITLGINSDVIMMDEQGCIGSIGKIFSASSSIWVFASDAPAYAPEKQRTE